MKAPGRGAVLRTLCNAERAGHRAVLARLKRVVRDVPMTAEQAQAVADETRARQAALKALHQPAKYAHDVIRKDQRKAA